MSQAAVRRIREAHRFSAIYRNGMASHHPMAIAALDAMGASDDDLARFEASYLKVLEAVREPVVTIEEGDEAAHLGAGASAYPEWVVYFTRAIGRDGAEAVLRRWVDRLVPAVASAAFHGAIRTAFAVEFAAEGELARALAYWCAAYHVMPMPVLPAGTRTPHEVFAAIADDPERAGRRMPGASIMERARNAARLPRFGELAASLDPDRLALDELAGAALRVYAASGDFAMLHGVTGLHAFRILGPYASDSGAALQDLWPALLATYIGTGSPAVAGWALPGDDSLAWHAIHALAVKREDEHDIKLAYSCWREWQHRGDDLYRRVASARVTS